MISSRFSEKLHNAVALRELKRTEIKVDNYQFARRCQNTWKVLSCLWTPRQNIDLNYFLSTLVKCGCVDVCVCECFLFVYIFACLLLCFQLVEPWISLWKRKQEGEQSHSAEVRGQLSILRTMAKRSNSPWISRCEKANLPRAQARARLPTAWQSQCRILSM